MLSRTILARAAPLGRSVAIRSLRSAVPRAPVVVVSRSTSILQREHTVASGRIWADPSEYALPLSSRFASSAAALAEREPEEDYDAAPFASSSSEPSSSRSPPSNSSSQTSASHPDPIDDDLQELVAFQSLKGAVHPQTVKALTVKPFKFEHMSEVQRRVLTRLPELAGASKDGKVVEREDLLVKAKTGTGKTIVSHTRIKSLRPSDSSRPSSCPLLRPG